jgi:transposase
VHGVTLVGPVNADASWQAKAQQGFDVATFGIDWDRQTATFPQGRTSVLWMSGHDRHEHLVVNMRFARADRDTCAARAQCTTEF